MKRLNVLLFVSLFVVSLVRAQIVTDFEELTLSPNTYWYDSSSSQDTSFNTSTGFQFPHQYSGYWASGWVYSNMKDSVTSGYTNLAASRAGGGYGGSDIYAVGQQNSGLKLDGGSTASATGVYVCNGTYAARSMETGDAFAKKFGGSTGDDPDYFLLTIKAFLNNSMSADSVNFYLADFRFVDNAQDYIVKDWTWVDLTVLGSFDSLQFNLSSSDNGQYGMNTPSFFCIDNLTHDLAVSHKLVESDQVSIYPNPSQGDFYVDLPSTWNGVQYQIYNNEGRLLQGGQLADRQGVKAFSILAPGIYFIRFNHEEGQLVKKIMVR